MSSLAAVMCGIRWVQSIDQSCFLHTANLLQLIHHHHVTHCAHADDVQIYASCAPSEASQLSAEYLIAWKMLHLGCRRVTPRTYADDVQIYGLSLPSETSQLSAQIFHCK